VRRCRRALLLQTMGRTRRRRRAPWQEGERAVARRTRVVAVAETSHPVSPTDSDLALGRDGQAVRVVGAWSREKLFYLARYIEIFTTGMKNRWPHCVYIDLFSGPGRSL